MLRPIRRYAPFCSPRRLQMPILPRRAAALSNFRNSSRRSGQAISGRPALTGGLPITVCAFNSGTQQGNPPLQYGLAL